MFKTLAFGLAGGFLGIATAGIMPVVVAILTAFGGASAIVGFGAWRAFRKMRRRREARRHAAATAGGPPVALPPPVQATN
ncbi:MAG: hypothetical protein M0R73_11060 [Dehalococcoidia bacterium]|nr:hypothetical protein [Dehalococcoidia bacterium]